MPTTYNEAMKTRQEKYDFVHNMKLDTTRPHWTDFDRVWMDKYDPDDHSHTLYDWDDPIIKAWSKGETEEVYGMHVPTQTPHGGHIIFPPGVSYVGVFTVNPHVGEVIEFRMNKTMAKRFMERGGVAWIKGELSPKILFAEAFGPWHPLDFEQITSEHKVRLLWERKGD